MVHLMPGRNHEDIPLAPLHDNVFSDPATSPSFVDRNRVDDCAFTPRIDIDDSEYGDQDELIGDIDYNSWSIASALSR